MIRLVFKMLPREAFCIETELQRRMLQMSASFALDNVNRSIFLSRKEALWGYCLRLAGSDESTI